ncbi:ATPase [Campylobacter rectus]|uniref:ATPase n=1 Tax=Campylobacter rectus TaxID=203 RepID=UPI0028EF11BE|nr:ATPase [Campylobacter rectus]
MNSEYYFSKKRLSSYNDEAEHKANFRLMQAIAPKLGIFEIITRNMICNTLMDIGKDNVLRPYAEEFGGVCDEFISNQTFGFWVKIINQAKIHKQINVFYGIDFRKYSKFNKKANWLDFQKVKIVYDLCVKIRNRAFHFENLFKTNKNGAPRISTRLGKTIVGIDPLKLEIFIDDILDCFDMELKIYHIEG